MRECDEAGRRDLAGPESPRFWVGLSPVRVVPGRQGVSQPGAHVGHDAGNDRGEDRGKDDLLQDRLEVDRVDADAGDRGADQAAEEGVGGTGRQPEPGDHVPEDRADESGEDDVRVIWTPSEPSLMMPSETSWLLPWRGRRRQGSAPPAMATAVFGLMAPVAMGVAMAFAVSWKPFVKSKNSASSITSATITVISTCCPI